MDDPDAQDEAEPYWPADAFQVPLYADLLRALGLNSIDPASAAVTVDTSFLAFLIEDLYRRLPFDPTFYVSHYTDLAAAYAAGNLPDLRRHFLNNGLREGRLPFEIPFDAQFYLKQYPGLTALFAAEGDDGLRSHYEGIGRALGLAPHPALEEPVARWGRMVGGLSALATASLDGALIHPYLHPLVDGPPKGFRGGLVLGDDPLSLRLRHRRGHGPVDSFPPNDEPVGTLPGEYVLGGFAYHHFGHVMAETVHRILPARAKFDCRRLIFVAAVDQQAPPGTFADLSAAQQTTFSFLGIDPNDVTVLRDNRVVETLHVAQQGAELATPPAPAYLELLRDYTCPRLRESDDGGHGYERIYVSRSKIEDGGLLGEAYFESLLEAEGWHVFHPQDHSFVSQLQTYRRAGTLLFLSGSAIHGCELFGRGDLGHCILLPRGHTPSRFFEVLLKPRARRFDMLTSATMIGTAVTDVAGEPFPQFGVSVLNPPALVHDLRALGLARVPGFSRAAYARAARADFDRYIACHRRRLGNPHEPVRLAPHATVSALTNALDAVL